MWSKKSREKGARKKQESMEKGSAEREEDESTEGSKKVMRSYLKGKRRKSCAECQKKGIEIKREKITKKFCGKDK